MIIGLAGEAGVGKNAVGDILARAYGFKSIAFADPIKRWSAELFDLSEESLWGPSEERSKPDGRYPMTALAKEYVDRERSRLADVAPDSIIAGFKKATCEEPGRHFLTPRTILQQLGTEGVRHAWPDAWADFGLRIAMRLLTEEHVDYSPSGGVFQCLFPERAEPFPGVAITDVRFRNEVVAIQNAGGHVIRIARKSASLQGSAGKHASELELGTMEQADFDSWIDNDGTLEDLAAAVADAMNMAKAIDLNS